MPCNKQAATTAASLKRACQNDDDETTISKNNHNDIASLLLPSVPLRKKTKTILASNSPVSLIAHLKPSAATPKKDFSSSLGLQEGKVLFPTEDMPRDTSWSPPQKKGRKKGRIDHPSAGALEVSLDDFDVSGSSPRSPNTVAIKFKAPSDSKRFSLNIGLADTHNNFESILFHFNPRQRQRGGQLVLNNKSGGSWGQAMNLPLNRLPMIFGQDSSTLLIQINQNGFDIFVDKEHCACFEHRTTMPTGQTRLVLQFPSSDDYGSPENWTVYRVWWGFCMSAQARHDLSTVAGVGAHHAIHPRKLFVRNLPKIHTITQVEVRRAQLERAFRKYGGMLGVTVTAPNHKSFAFVEVDSAPQAELALGEMRNLYQLCRARQSKFEEMKDAAQVAGRV